MDEPPQDIRNKLEQIEFTNNGKFYEYYKKEGREEGREIGVGLNKLNILFNIFKIAP